jgi:hypothetical protein
LQKNSKGCHALLSQEGSAANAARGEVTRALWNPRSRRIRGAAPLTQGGVTVLKAVAAAHGNRCDGLSGSALQQRAAVTFTNIASQAGINFKHQNGASPQKFMPETMGGGALIFDYDGDGWPDIFLVNGGSFVDTRAAAAARHGLYRNNGNGTFTDKSANSGIGVAGYAMGVCSADYDNDGWPDLYVTGVTTNKLYRNSGSGSFLDVTAKSGAGGSGVWSSSCAFADIDNDGDVDLFVTNYVDFTANNNKYCAAGGDIRTYCHPKRVQQPSRHPLPQQRRRHFYRHIQRSRYLPH